MSYNMSKRLVSKSKEMLHDEKQKIICKDHLKFPMGALLSRLDMETIDLIVALIELGATVADSQAVTDIDELSAEDKINITEKLIEYRAKEVAAMEIANGITNMLKERKEDTDARN